MEPFARQMHRHPRLVLVLLSGFVVPLLTNLFSSWLEKTFGQNQAQMMQLMGVVIAVSVALWVLLLALQRQEVVLVPPNRQPPRMAGLVALVGRGDPNSEPARLALDYHLEGEPGLQACWLIASKGATGSMPTAMQLNEQYKERCQIEVCSISDAFDVQETYETVREIYEEKVPEAGLKPSEVITDFTGGTSPMSAGAVLACGDEYPLQYYTGRQPGIASTPLWVQFRRSTGG